MALLKRVVQLADQPFEAQFDGSISAKGLSDPSDEHYTIDCAVAYLMTGEAIYAQRACHAGHALLNPRPKADLSTANRSYMLLSSTNAVDAWSDAERFQFETLLARCALAINQDARVTRIKWATTGGP